MFQGARERPVEKEHRDLRASSVLQSGRFVLPHSVSKPVIDKGN